MLLAQHRQAGSADEANQKSTDLANSLPRKVGQEQARFALAFTAAPLRGFIPTATLRGRTDSGSQKSQDATANHEGAVSSMQGGRPPAVVHLRSRLRMIVCSDGGQFGINASLVITPWTRLRRRTLRTTNEH